MPRWKFAPDIWQLLLVALTLTPSAQIGAIIQQGWHGDCDGRLGPYSAS